jgi:hypothetical protein
MSSETGGGWVPPASWTEQFSNDVVSSPEEKKEFVPVIPRGWTNLKHGTNLLNWGDNNPFTVEKITLTRPLSVISQEDFDRDQSHGGGYNTTRNYAAGSKPGGMSDSEFQLRNKPFEIRVIYFKNHVRQADDEEYSAKLDKTTLDQIAKYYFLNTQGGRHPLVPRGETLLKLGQVQENGADVFYFVPESVAAVYEKESGVEVKK